MIEFGNPKDMWVDTLNMDVCLYAMANGKRLLCPVRRAAIDDHCGNGKTEEARLKAAREHFTAITAQLQRKIALGEFESDEVVILETEDWRP